jgi:putative oxidoreductase
MNLGLLVLRLVVGLLFVGHGAQKVFGRFGGHGPEGTGAFFESLGLRPGRWMALAAGAAEIAGGLLIAAGLLTPFAAALLTAVMVTAILTAHRASGLWINQGGFEYNLVLIGVFFALSGVGPGRWSLDHALGLDIAGTGWALAELAAGVLGAWTALALGRAAIAYRGGPAHPVGR